MIDCDIHPCLPGLAALLPYLPDPWRDIVETRGIEELNPILYPAGSPLTVRADWRAGAGSLEAVRRDCLDGFGAALAVLNPLYGVQMLFSEDMAAAYCRALNDWVAREWLDGEARLRASIVVPLQSVERAVDEIERCAADTRFVQVLLLANGDHLLGRRHYWPVYEAAARHGLPIGIHAGSAYHNPPTSVGWPAYAAEDYAAQAQAFQSQLTSLVCEGVFKQCPALKVVLLESGWTWLPAHLWRLTKYWRGLRSEVPWVDRSPFEIVRDHVRLSLTPTDGPADALERVIEHIGSDEMLLFSSDYPHGQFEGGDPWPEGLPTALRHKIGVENPRATYARLLETVA